MNSLPPSHQVSLLNAQDVRSLLAEAQMLTLRLATFNDIAITLQTQHDADTVLYTMAQQARWILDFEYCALIVAEGQGYTTMPLYGTGEVPRSQTLPWLPDAYTLQVLQQGHPLCINTLPEDGLSGIRSVIIVPLHESEAIIGTINFYAGEGVQYTTADLRVAYALVIHAAAVRTNARLFTVVSRARDELHIILESIGDAVLVLDTKGRIVLSNKALRQALQLTDRPLTGMRALRLLRNADHAPAPLIPEAAARALQALWTDGLDTSTQGIVHLTDGRSFEWVIVPIRQQANCTGYVLTARDVSARIEVERLRDNMIHMLVHDLRSPVGGLSMGLDLLAEWMSVGDTAEYQRTLGGMRHAVNDLLDRINLLLVTNKLETRQMILDRKAYPLGKLLHQAIATLAPADHLFQSRCTLHIQSDLPHIWVDAQLVQRVLENILGNAYRFTPPGGTIRVGAHILPDPNWIEVWIEDDGPGIAPELHQAIFEKYVHLHTRRHTGGTGLGLFFCKLAVEAHGGKIGVRSISNTGACFWFRLPTTATDTPHEQDDPR